MIRRKKYTTQSANSIVKLITDENRLINDRLTWIIQINGFMFAAIALIKESTILNLSILFLAFGILAITVNLFGLCGVHASRRQLNYLKHQIEDKYYIDSRPYGDKTTSQYFSALVYGIPCALICFWSIYLYCIICKFCWTLGWHKMYA